MEPLLRCFYLVAEMSEGEPSLTISVDMVLLILDIRSDSRFDFEYRVQGVIFIIMFDI